MPGHSMHSKADGHTCRPTHPNVGWTEWALSKLLAAHYLQPVTFFVLKIISVLFFFTVFAQNIFSHSIPVLQMIFVLFSFLFMKPSLLITFTLGCKMSLHDTNAVNNTSRSNVTDVYILRSNQRTRDLYTMYGWVASATSCILIYNVSNWGRKKSTSSSSKLNMRLPATAAAASHHHNITLFHITITDSLGKHCEPRQTLWTRTR